MIDDDVDELDQEPERAHQQRGGCWFGRRVAQLRWDLNDRGCSNLLLIILLLANNTAVGQVSREQANS